MSALAVEDRMRCAARFVFCAVSCPRCWAGSRKPEAVELREKAKETVPVYMIHKYYEYM